MKFKTQCGAMLCVLMLAGCGHDYGELKIKSGVIRGYTRSGSAVTVPVSEIKEASHKNSWGQWIVKVNLKDGRAIYGGGYKKEGDAMVAAFEVGAAKLQYDARKSWKSHSVLCEIKALPWIRSGKVTLHELVGTNYELSFAVKHGAVERRMTCKLNGDEILSYKIR